MKTEKMKEILKKLDDEGKIFESTLLSALETIGVGLVEQLNRINNTLTVVNNNLVALNNTVQNNLQSLNNTIQNKRMH